MFGLSWEETYLTGVAVIAAGLSNFVTKRPLLSRLYIYPLYGAGGYGLGHIVSKWNHKRIAERELAIWDYVQQHPEDFPELSPKKFKDVLEEWHPIR